MHLGVLPRFRVLRTSETEKGQIYIPFINWLLLAAVILLVVLFETSSALAAAYGLAVTGDMVITSCLLFIVAWKFWRWSLATAALVIAPFLAIELIFLSSKRAQDPAGRVVPAVGRDRAVHPDADLAQRYAPSGGAAHRGRPPLAEFILKAESSSVPRVPGTAIFLTGNAHGRARRASPQPEAQQGAA